MPLHAAILPIDRVVVVGCGGNGSIFVNHLCRIQQACVALGGTGFEIVLYDDDVVTPANLVRQCFCEDDLGAFKAEVLAQRLTSFYGCNATPVATKFSHIPERSRGPFSGHDDDQPGATVLVGCVDNVPTRRVLAKNTAVERWSSTGPEARKAAYWLDLGNAATTGQVILGGSGLPNVFDLLPQMTRIREKEDTPSCSAAEALAKQDLFINSTLATFAGQLLWKLIRKGQLHHHGFFINLERGQVVPVPVKA